MMPVLAMTMDVEPDLAGVVWRDVFAVGKVQSGEEAVVW